MKGDGIDLGPVHLPPELGRDGITLRAGEIDFAHPLNLGRDTTAKCCAGWWAEHDRAAAAGRGLPAFDDDGHHAQIPGVPKARPRRLRADPEAVRPAVERAPQKRRGGGRR